MVTIVTVIIIVLIGVCGHLIANHGHCRGTCTRVSIRLHHHCSLVPGLMRDIGNCVTRRQRALTTIVGTHGDTVDTDRRTTRTPNSPRTVRRLSTTRNILADALNQFFTLSRTCPSLGTGRGVTRLVRRLHSARGHVTFTHRTFGSTIALCGARHRVFPNGLITGGFGFQPTRLLRRDAPRMGTIPGISFG